MKRTERMFALLTRLRAAGPRPVPAAVLAEGLEVSVRTVRRDLDALARSGLPVQVARDSGGYVLVETPPDPVRAAVVRGVTERRVLLVDYRDRHRELTRRLVEPHSLVITARARYVVGWCRLRGDRRVFRLDRVLAARVTGEPFDERDLDPMLGWGTEPPAR